MRNHFCTIKNAAMILVGIAMPIFSSCSSLAMAPHENFKEHMSSNIGSSIDTPREPGVALPKYFLGSMSLVNGNIENEYQYRGTCRYFFEFDQNTRIIIGWRFEGSEKDCAITP